MKHKLTQVSLLLITCFILCSCNLFLTKKTKIYNSQNALTYTDSTLSNYLVNGIDYYATGATPENWTLTMDFDKVFSFTTSSGISFNCPPTNNYRDSIQAFTLFFANDKNRSIKIIIPTRWNENKESTTVEFNGITYKGHGGSIIDKRLHNSWILESLDDDKINKIDYKNGLPNLNFNLIENRMNGFDGCNGLGSEIKILGNRIQFGPIYSTLKACPNINTDILKINLLDSKLVEYYFKNDQLILYLINDSRLTFRKKY